MSDTKHLDKHPTEERWHSLVRNMPGFVAIIGRDATITFVNRVPADLTAEQIIGSSISEFVPCRYRETILEKAARVFETGQVEHCEIIVSGSNGTSIWWSARLGPVQENGTIHELIMLCTDLWTPAMRKAKETSALGLAKPAACVCTPQSLTEQTFSDSRINDRIRFDTALREGEEKFLNLAEHSLQGIFLIQDERIVFANRRASEIMEIPYAELRAMDMGQLMQKSIHPDYREGMRAQYLKRLRGELPSAQYEVKAMTPGGEDRWAEISAATTMYGGRPAVQIAVADVTARKEAEQALKESEEKYRTLVENARNAIFSISRDGYFLFMNSVAAQSLGGKPEDLLGKLMTDHFPPAIAERQLVAIQRVIDNGKGETVEAQTVLGGVPRWHLTSIQPLNGHDGKPRCAFLVATDITDRIDTNRQLTRERDFTRSILETANSLILCLDESANITVFNEECERVTGYSRQEVLGRNWPEIFLPPENRHEGLTNFGEWVHRHPHDRYEGAIVTKSGEIRTILWSNSSFVSPETGQLTAIAIGQDITETKRANQRLWEAETKYRSLVEQLPAITYTAALDEASTTLYVSPQVETLLGFSQADYRANPDLWRRRLHPDDRDYVMAEVTRCHATGEPFDCEYRMVAKDGRVIWFHDQAALVCDDTGAPKLLQGVQFDIAEQKQAEQALKESEARFERVAQHSREMVWEVDTEGVFRYVSHACEEILGYRPDEMIDTMHFYDLQSEVVRDEFKAASLAQIARGESFYNQVNKAKTKDGRTVWFLTSGTPVLDSLGNLRGYIGTDLDITERKRAEEALRRKNDYLTALHETNLDLASELDLDSLLENIIRRVGLLVGTQAGYLDLHEPGADRLTPKVGFGISTEALNYGVKSGEGLAGKVWETRQMIVIDDYDTWPERLPIHAYGLFRAVISLPLLSKSDVLGVLGLAFGREETRTFDQEEIDLLSQFARFAAIAIENARLYSTARQELAERKRAEERLRSSQEAYRDLVENVSDVLYAVDLDLVITYVSPVVKSVLGYEPSEVVGQSVTSFIFSEDLPLIAAAAGDLFNNRLYPSEYRMLTKTGDVRWVRSSSRPILEGDHVVGARGVMTDITERKLAEDELRETKIFLDKIINSIGDPVIVKDRQHRFVLVNDASCQIFGHSREQIIGKSGTDLFPQEQVEAFWEHDEHVFKTGEESISEVMITGGVGPSRCMLTTKTLYIDKGGNRFIVGIIRDITNRKRAEEVLEESRRQLIEAQRVAHLGNWDWDAVNNRLMWSDQVSRICGLPIGEFEPGLGILQSLLHPDEHERLRAIIAEMAGNMPDCLGRYQSGEFRIVRPDGSERVIHWRMEPVLDAEGRLLRTFGIAQDITERKQMEEALQEVNRELEEEQRALMEKNIALKEVLGQIREEVNHVKLQIQTNLERLVMPTLLRVKERARVGDRVVVDLLESLLKDVASPFVSNLESRFSSLTPRESEVCSMLQNGLQSKEIALALGISVRTVEKFRQRIRLKLGMDKTEVNLTTFLRSL